MRDRVECYAARVAVGANDVPGFAFLWASQKDAETAFDICVGHLVAGERPSSWLAFEAESEGSYVLTLTANSETATLRVGTNGFPEAELKNFERLLQSVAYYFVIFGYYGDDGAPQLLDPTEHALFKSSIEIDTRIAFGAKSFEVPWRTLLAGEIFLGTFARHAS